MTNEKSNLLEILVVEDQPEFAETAKKILDTKEGVNVDCANDYSEAIQKIDNKKYDGALIDLYFPEKTNSGKKELIRSYLSDWEEACDKWGGDATIAYTCLKNEIMDNDESKQPIGFLIGKELKDREIPSVIVSSAGFGHGSNDNPFYALRVGASRLFGLGKEFEPHTKENRSLNWIIAKDTLQRVVYEQGQKIEDIKNELCNVTRQKGSDASWVNKLDDVNVVYYAMGGGILEPIKGVQTYEKAFEILKEKMK